MRMHQLVDRNRLLRFAIGAIALSSLSAGSAHAQSTRPSPSRSSAERPSENQATEPVQGAPTLADLEEIVARLQSSDVDEVNSAVDLLSVIDHREVVDPIARLLRSGQPDAVTDHALEALRGIAEPASLEVLTEFTHHRRVGARRRAYQAIAAIRDRHVPELVEQGLRDSERTIRATCATALGTIDARSSTDTLFRAFERGVVEAASSIGKLGDERSIERFHEHLGRQPLSVMLSGYEQYLKRNDIDEQTKIAIVNRLGEVSGHQVREFLTGYLMSLPEGPRRPPPRRAEANAQQRMSLREVVGRTIRQIPLEPTPTASPEPSPTAVPAVQGAQ